MPVQLNVSQLKLRLASHDWPQARKDLGVLLTLLDYKETGMPSHVELDKNRCESLYYWIFALRPATLKKYKKTLELILETIEYDSIRTVEVKEDWQEVEFPCPAWCRTRASATEKQVEVAGGLSPAYSTEMCYALDGSWGRLRLLFGYIEGKIVLPLSGDDVATRIPNSLSEFGIYAYYFLVPTGTRAYSHRGLLTSEVAFPGLVATDEIWFAGKTGEQPHKVSWKKDALASGLPQPAVAAASPRLRSSQHTAPLWMME